MQNHTPEPWTVGNIGPSGYPVISEVNDIYTADATSLPDAERIVACVNGCWGINPDSVGAMLEALRSVRIVVLDMAACSNPFDTQSGILVETAKYIESTIKKAEGE